MLVGILVDVSGSMANVLQPNNPRLDDRSVTRAQSMFSTIINIVEQDNSFQEKEEIFALAFGLDAKETKTCDLLTLLDYVNQLDQVHKNHGHENLTKLLAENGAPYADHFIQKYVPLQAAGHLCKVLSENPELLHNTIANLPLICKNVAAYNSYLAGEKTYYAGKKAYSAGKHAASTTTQSITSFWRLFFNSASSNGNNDDGFDREMLRRAMEESKKSLSANEDSEEKIAKKYIKEAMESATTIQLKDMVKPQKRPLPDAIKILREVANPSDPSTSTNELLTSKELSNLVNAIKPFIYGDTPMCEALKYASEIFQSNSDTIRVLFILSDGKATDGNPVEITEQFKHDVTIFACLLTSKQIHEPKRLYDEPQSNWSKEERTMFEMSSMVSNESPAMEILLNNQWKLGDSGQSRLFIHANDPEVIDEFSSLVRQIGEKKDALLDMLGYVSLDLYINYKMNMFDPRDQGENPTCYAHAVATVFHLAMCRIRGRDGDIPKFEDIRDRLIQKYGNKSTKTEDVLKEYAPIYRLRYRKLDQEVEARQAINDRHSLIATFRWTVEQCAAFNKFYENNPKGILRSEDLPKADASAKPSGHAVVLTRCDAISLTFMNSWGTTFANGGFFRVKDQSVLNFTFYDVYWELEDLTEDEKQAYESKCKEVVEELARMVPSSFHDLKYKCPNCSELSSAKQFSGHLLEAICPLCQHKFKPTALGLIRSLYTR